MKKRLFLVLLMLCLSSIGWAKNDSSEPYFVKLRSDLYQPLYEGSNLDHWTSNDQLQQLLEELKIERCEATFHLDAPELKNIFTIYLGDPQSDKLSRLQSHPWIVYAEKVPVYENFHTPNDLHSNQWNLKKVSAELAWDVQRNASKIVIAVVDDAVDISHPDLQGNKWVNPTEVVNGVDDDGNGYVDDINGYDVSDNDNDPRPPSSATSSVFSHGTHCAGIASASTNNSVGIASLGYNARIMAVKTKPDASSGGGLPHAYKGVEYAIAAHAHIISMSWGGGSMSTTYQTLFNVAHNRGIVLVAAAGNSNVSAPMYPASYNHVISVAASDNSDLKASFSNYGATIDVTAPGVNIWSTVPGSSQYDFKNGTSMACPLVSGLCALMLANVPKLTPDSLEDCLKRSCDPLSGPFAKQLGAGRINAQNALTCLLKAPLANFEADTLICPGQQVRFTNNTAGIGGISYKWTFVGGTPATSTLENPLVTYATSGWYSVTLEATNSYGKDNLTKSIYVNIKQPEALISGVHKLPYGKRVGIEITFKGEPPFKFTVSDGSNSYSESGISYSPYIFDYGPVIKDSELELTDFSDNNCNGSLAGKASIILLSDTCQNLVLNPGFIQRDDVNCKTVGFSSDMKLDCKPSTAGFGYIHITDNSSLWNGVFWSGVKDHTPGGGTNFMLGDGAGRKTKVWYQNVSVLAGKSYDFSAWFVNANVNGRYSGATSSFEMWVNGTSSTKIASTGSLGKTTPWKKYGGTYTASKTETVELSIVNVETVSGGNDFAIDDVVFMCSSSGPACFKSRDTALTACEGDSLRLWALNGTDYSWTPSVEVSNDTIRNPWVKASQSRLYTVQYQDANCNYMDSFYVEVHPRPVLSVKNNIYRICLGDSAKPVITGANSYQWFPDYHVSDIFSSSPLLSPLKDTTYVVVGTDANGCVSEGYVRINLDSCCGSHASISLTPDSVICRPDKVQFNSTSRTRGAVTYDWDFGPSASISSYTGKTPPLVSFKSGGSHTVRLIITDSCGTDTAHQTIHCIEVEANAGNDTNLCIGDTVRLGSAPISDQDYSWSPGSDLSDSLSSNPYLIFTGKKSYVLQVTDVFSGCTGYDTIEIGELSRPEFDLGEDTVICSGDSIHVDLSSYSYDFVWHTGSTSNSFTSHGDTLVWVRARTNTCEFIDSLSIDYKFGPEQVWLGDTTICEQGTLTLSAKNPGSTYLWRHNNKTQNEVVVDSEGTYFVEVRNECGSLTDSIYVEQIDCDCFGFIPNVFTPNGDHLNETFQPVVTCPLKDFHINIYNRWGELLYTSEEFESGWDGTYQNWRVPEGVYFWILTYQGYENGNETPRRLSGTVTILR